MTITKDPETGLFWQKTSQEPVKTSFGSSDILPEGAAILERAVAIKKEWTTYVDKIKELEALGEDVGMEIGYLEGQFTENFLDTVKIKIKEK